MIRNHIAVYDEVLANLQTIHEGLFFRVLVQGQQAELVITADGGHPWFEASVIRVRNSLPFESECAYIAPVLIVTKSKENHSLP